MGKKQDNRTRNFMCLLYKESTPEDFRERIKAYHMEAFVSPLHEYDVNEDGTPKKPHWHMILRFKGKKSDDQVIAIMKDIGERGACIDPTGREFYVVDFQKALRYHCHLDEADKHHYPITEEWTTSSKDIFELMMDSKEEGAMVDEMLDWCTAHRVKYFRTLADYARKEREDWMRLIRSKNTVFLTAWFKSAAYEMRETYAQAELERVLQEIEAEGPETQQEEYEREEATVSMKTVIEERKAHQVEIEELNTQIEYMTARIEDLQKRLFQKLEEDARTKVNKDQ